MQTFKTIEQMTRITKHESRITNHESRITNHESRITNHSKTKNFYVNKITSNFFLFIALLLMINHPAQSQIVNYYLDPSHDSRYIAWQANPEITEEVTGFRFEIFQLDANDNPSNLLESITLSKNYLKLPAHYLNDNYGYRVSAITNSGDLTGDIEYTCPGCGKTKLHDYSCNGTTYAYNIDIHEKASTGDYFYSVTAGRDCNQWGFCTPFYRYMSQTEFNAWRNLIGYTKSLSYNPTSFIDFSTVYFNMQGNPIPGGLIYRIDKRKEQFCCNPRMTDPLSSITPLYTSATIFDAISVFNQYKMTVPHPDFSHLYCVVSPTNPPGQFIGMTNPNSTVKTIIRAAYYSNVIIIDDTLVGESNINNLIWNQLRRLNQELIDSLGAPTGNSYFKDIIITRIDSNQNQINFDENEIFQDGGFVAYPTNVLTSGLYRLNVRFEDNSWIGDIFEYSDNTHYISQSTIADSVDVVVYPNPLNDNRISISITTERMLDLTLRIIGNDAVVRYETDLINTSEMGQSFSLNISEFNLNENAYFYVQFVFSDGSITSIPVFLVAN